MKKAVVLVKGWNVYDWRKTIGLLKEPFEALGYRVEVLDYGYWPFPWQATTGNFEVAERLSVLVYQLIEEGYTVDLAGHSNGCTITYLASNKYQIPINTYVAIQPALRKDSHPCLTAKLTQVWYNNGDTPVVLGKWLRWFTPWAEMARPWGEMGHDGYKGETTYPAVVQFNGGEDFSVKADGHSDYFSKKLRGYFTPRMSRYCDDQRTAVKPCDIGV